MNSIEGSTTVKVCAFWSNNNFIHPLLKLPNEWWYNMDSAGVFKAIGVSLMIGSVAGFVLLFILYRQNET